MGGHNHSSSLGAIVGGVNAKLTQFLLNSILAHLARREQGVRTQKKKETTRGGIEHGTPRSAARCPNRFFLTFIARHKKRKVTHIAHTKHTYTVAPVNYFKAMTATEADTFRNNSSKCVVFISIWVWATNSCGAAVPFASGRFTLSYVQCSICGGRAF